MLPVSIAALSLAWFGPLAGPPGEFRPASTFPEKVIRRADSQFEWPFSVDQGELTCVAYGGQKHVFFAEILTDEQMGEFGNMTLPRMVVVSANPLAYLASIEDRELYAPFDSIETLIVRLAPFEKMGWALCDADKARDPEKKT